MASKTVRDRLRKRREQIQDTLVDDGEDQDEKQSSKRTRIKSGERSTGPDLNMTWDAALAELTATTGSELSDQEVVEEIRNAETLQEDLRSKHRDRKRELKAIRARREEDLLKEQMKSAKENSRDKLERSRRLREEREMEGGEETIEADQAGRAESGAPGILDRRGSQQPLLDAGGTPPEDEAGATTKRTKNLNATIRERLRNKIKSARDKAETEAAEETGKRRLRGLRDRPTTTRFDDATVYDEARDERKIQAARERLRKERRAKGGEDVKDEKTAKMKENRGKRRWQTVQEKILTPKKPVKGISMEEAMDFFCRDWEPEPEPEVKPEPEVIPEVKPEAEDKPEEGGTSADGEKEQTTADEEKEKDETEKIEEAPAEGEDTTEEGKKKKKDKKKKDDEVPLLGLEEVDENEEWGYTAIRRAEYLPYKDKQEKEGKEFYVPSMIAIAESKKIREDRQPRHLAEEGLYVGERPVVSYRNENKLEDRLLKEPDGTGRKWFGEDGKVQILPDPLKKTPTRPMMMDEPNPLIETVYVKAITRDFETQYIDGRVDLLGKRYQLDLDINQLNFSHHHLFSREHVLASRLRALYKEYTHRGRNDIVNYYSEKLRAIKQATLHLREAIAAHKKMEKPGSFLADQERRLKDYVAEIKMVRQERDAEQNHDRVVLKNIIRTWKEIKNVRQLQDFCNTPVKLVVRREATDKETEEQDWLAEVEEELEELKMEYREEFINKQAHYNQLLETHREQQKNKKDATKRQKKREKKKVEEMTHSEQQEEIADQQIIAADQIQLPDPPVAFNEEESRELVTSKATRIRRAPGEPKLFPELLEGNSITPKNQCKKGERDRRDDVDRYKCYFKIFVNNKEVARTQAKPLGQDFIVLYARILNIQLVSWPESIKLEIHESAGFSSEKLADIFLAVPEHSVTSQSVQMEDMDFSSDQDIGHRHEGIGSGSLFDFRNEDTVKLHQLMTTGQLTTGICWAVDEDGTPMVPPSSATTGMFSSFKNYDAMGALGAAGSVDMEKLTKWIADSRLDPNDPRNADLVYLMKPTGSDGAPFRMPDYFRLEQLQEEFDFVTERELDDNPRFRLIQYRDQEVVEFKNWKQIPAYAKDIPLDTFKEYERKRKDEFMDRIRDIESHRAQVTRFMQQVREQVLQRFRILSHQKTFASMVVEEDVPQIGTLGPTLLKLTQARRPLRPVRKERKKVIAQNMDGIDVNILVNIIRAYDVPIRTDSSSGVDGQIERRRGQTMYDGYGRPAAPVDMHRAIKHLLMEDLVCPMVEILFQHETYKTTVANGPNPSWNEEIRIPFKPPSDDMSPSSLQTCKDVFYLNLFDYSEHDVLEDDRQRETRKSQLIEKNYLGSLKIPFSTLYLNSKIEGTFRINMPPVLLGYTHQNKNTRTDTTGLGGDIEIGIGDSDSSYLTVFITIEPQLSLPESVHEVFDTNEDGALQTYADTWLYELETRFPKREYRTMVTSICGQSVFITRYFKAIKPPADVVDNESAKMTKEERVARYVSLIPFVADSLVFPGLCDIWSTCDQFMNMLAGDEEEHAVLLNNYFLDMGKKSWLVIGSAIPEGPTAYVMTEEDKDFWFWNASTGEHFNYKNNYCPLKSIGCVVDESNIWANIQTSDEPWRMTFDFTNGKLWKPFFGGTFPDPGLGSVQPSSLQYLRTEKAYVGDLQDKIERTLREKMMQWRPRNITRWNRYCMQAFRQLLVKFEENGGISMRKDPVPELDQILKTYKMTGLPINVPFTEIEPIVDSVYSTGLHDIDSNDVEFALAVYICPYPNSILSVWVYVASLVRKR